MPKLVTSGELARAFGVDHKTIKNWAEKGTIPPPLLTPGSHRRWYALDAARALRAHGREVPAGWESAAQSEGARS